MNNFLKIIFAILFIVLVGEVVYFLYSFYGVKKDTANVTPTMTPALPTTTPALAKEGFSTKWGGRQVDRVIQEKVVNDISKKILKGEISTGNEFTYGS